MTELSCGFRVGRPRVGRPRSASPPVRPAKVPSRPRSAGFPYDTTMDAAIPSAPSNAPAARAAQQSLVVSSLAKILPASCILYRGEETAPYECDALTAYRQLPLVVVIPESE